jgi:hypothetical protein
MNYRSNIFCFSQNWLAYRGLVETHRVNLNAAHELESERRGPRGRRRRGDRPRGCPRRS